MEHDGLYTADTGETLEVVHREYSDSSRWSEVWELILKDNDGQLWRTIYQVAATEMQEHTPPEYQHLHKVEAREVVRIKYVAVK